jgi:putative PIN family toxin of toxin-antitoxin system
MAERGQVEVVASMELLEEIARVLRYDRIAEILGRSGTRPQTVMETIVRLCAIMDVKVVARMVREDPTDNLVLACAKQAGAQFLVSGDHHILRIGQYGRTKIVNASAYLKIQPVTTRKRKRH